MDSTLPVTVLSNEGANNEQRKGGGRRSGNGSGLQPPSIEDVFNCPRCDSPNTKFCYYNNYCLTQPRHYCKACRRYWTRGGTLRNVPIGGGCRKNKKFKPSSSSSSFSSSSSSSTTASSRLFFDIKDPLISYSSESGSNPFKLFHGLSSSYFHLGTSELFPSSRFKYSTSTCGLLTNEFSNININRNQSMAAYRDPSTVPSPISNSSEGAGASTAVAASDLLGTNHPNFSQSIMRNTNIYTTFASNIDSFSSSINSQDLYWKLQQQRLGMPYGGESHDSMTKETSATSINVSDLPSSYIQNQHQHDQPISFHTPVNSESDLGFVSGSVPGSNLASVVGVDGISPSNDQWYNLGGGGSSNWNSTTSRSNNTDGNCTDVMKTWKEMHHLISALPFGSKDYQT